MSKFTVWSDADINESSSNGNTAVGGVPGAASNNGAVPTYQGGNGSGGTTTKTDSEKTYELNKQVQKIVRAPGTVTRMSVSVIVDDDPNNPNPALIQNIQNAVNAAAGIDPGVRHPNQALSAPDALATWVAMKSIRPGDRQS